MIRIIFPVFLVLAAIQTAYADWTEAAKACGELIAEQTVPRCGSCAALWPQISKCAADAEGIDPTRTDVCIASVNNQNWAQPMYFDRIAQVFSCLSK